MPNGDGNYVEKMEARARAMNEARLRNGIVEAIKVLQLALDESQITGVDLIDEVLERQKEKDDA